MSDRKVFLIPGRNGYDISIMSNVRDESNTILLCLHGFGGDKHSTVIAALTESLDRDGVGVVTFDWPAHGDSPAKDSDLTVENCLRDLDTVLSYIRGAWQKPISCFATSFGGYLAALYQSGHQDAFDKLVLRSPALRMPQTFIDFFPEAEKERFLAGEPMTMGYERTMELTVLFYDSLKAHDAFSASVPDPKRVLILQGDCDDVVSPADTAAYADKNHIRVAWFPGTDHRYKSPGDPEKIVSVTREFLFPRQGE